MSNGRNRPVLGVTKKQFRDEIVKAQELLTSMAAFIDEQDELGDRHLVIPFDISRYARDLPKPIPRYCEGYRGGDDITILLDRLWFWMQSRPQPHRPKPKPKGKSK